MNVVVRNMRRKKIQTCVCSDVVWIAEGKYSCDFYSTNGVLAYSEEVVVQQLNSLFICFMDRHNSDTDTDCFDSVFCFSALQQENSHCYFSSACLHSSLQSRRAPAVLQFRLLIGGSGCPRPWYVRATFLWASAGPLSSSLAHKFWARDYGFIWPAI